VLLVHRPKYDDWSLPKGKSEPGEHILLTAVREVWEETCVRPVLGPRLPTVEYLSWGHLKRVSYWSSFNHGQEAAPGNEIDAVAWLPLTQARAQLADTHDDPVLSAFRPLETVPLILVNPPAAIPQLEDGRLSDIAPTLLDILGLPKPPAMTGHSLIVAVERQRAAD